MPHNIERSAFKPGQYVGWDSQGERYVIKRDRPSGTRSARAWWVYPQTLGGIPCFYAPTLALVGQRLAARASISSLKA